MPDWKTLGKCRDLPPDEIDRIFFTGPTPGSKPRHPTGPEAEAITICADCPVRQPCGAWALNHPTDSRFGVWGGLTEYQRRRWRESHRPTA